MSDQPTRVQFIHKQVLRTRDLTDEEAYQLGMQRRHQIGAHQWGIVTGLRLKQEGSSVFVERGAAVDGYGRTVILSDRMRVEKVNLNEDKGKQQGGYDFWLVYNHGPATSTTRTDRSPCHREVVSSQLVEIPRVLATKPTDIDPRGKPYGVAPSDRDFGPHRQPPNDPERLWGVYLGRVSFQATNANEQKWVIDESRRPYAGLMAERIIAPFGHTRKGDEPANQANQESTPLAQYIQLGTGEKPGDPYRFAVRFPVDTQEELVTENLRGQPTAIPPFAITPAGEVQVNGPGLSVNGDVTMMRGGAVKFRSPPPLPKGQSQPADLAAWQLRRTPMMPKGVDPVAVAAIAGLVAPAALRAAGLTTGEKPAPEKETLLITLPGDEAGGQVVVGGWNPEQQRFSPFVTVEPSGNSGLVRVFGNLVVNGLFVGRQAIVGGTDDPAPSNGGATKPEDDPLLKLVLASWVDNQAGSDFIAAQVWNTAGMIGPNAFAKTLSDDKGKLKVIAEKMVQTLTLGAEAVAESLPDDQPKLATITAGVMAHSTGPAAVAQGLPNIQTKLETIAAGIFSKPTGTAAVAQRLPDGLGPLTTLAQAILNKVVGATAIRDSLTNDAAKLQVIAGGILNQANGATAIAQSLTNDLPSLTTLAGGILGQAQGAAAVAASLSNNAGQLGTLAVAILARPLGPAAVAASLTNNLGQLGTIAAGILGQAQGATAFAQNLANDAGQLQVITAGILGQGTGPNAVGNALLANAVAMGTVATQLLAAPDGVTAVSNGLPNTLATLRDITQAILIRGDGPAAVAAALPAISDTDLRAVMTPVLADQQSASTVASALLAAPGTQADYFSEVVKGLATPATRLDHLAGPLLKLGTTTNKIGWLPLATALSKKPNGTAPTTPNETLAFELFSWLKTNHAAVFTTIKDAITAVP